MDIIHLNTNDFDETVKEGKVLVDFWATWCMPCRMLAPTIEDIASSMPDVKVCKVDIDKNPELAVRFGVMSIPTVIIFSEGDEIEKLVGVRDMEEYTDILAGL